MDDGDIHGDRLSSPHPGHPGAHSRGRLHDPRDLDCAPASRPAGPIPRSWPWPIGSAKRGSVCTRSTRPSDTTSTSRAPDASQRRASLDRLHLAAEALAVLGGTLYVIHPGGEDQRWVWERDMRMNLAVEGLTEMAAACREKGQTLVVETPLPHLLGGALDDFQWILDRLPEEGVGVCIDTSHCALGGFLFDALARFGPRLVHLQVSDNRGVTDDHLPPGQGHIDWRRFRDALAEVRYDGVFMLEVSGNGDVGAHARAAAAAVRAVLEGP